MSVAIDLLYKLPVKIASDTLSCLTPDELDNLKQLSDKTHRLVLHHRIFTNQGEKIVCPQIFDELSFAQLIDRSLCLKADNSRSLKAWDISTRRPHTIARLPDDDTLLELIDNKLYLISSSKGLQVLDPNDGTIIHSSALEDFAAQGPISYFKVCQNRLYCCFAKDRLLCWNIETGAREASFHGLTSKVTHLIDQNGLVTTSSEDHLLTVWFRYGGHPISICKGHQHAIRQIALFNSLLISASMGGSIRFWDLATGQCISTRLTQMPCFTISNKQLYTPSVTDPRSLDVIDLESFTVHSSSSTHEQPIVCFAKDAGVTYSGSLGGTIIRTTSSTEHVVFQQKHQGPVTKIMSLDDGLLVSYGKDQTAKVWKAETGELLQSYVLEHFDLSTFMYSQGRIIFVSGMNIFGAYDYTKPFPTSTSPRMAVQIPTQNSTQKVTWQ